MTFDLGLDPMVLLLKLDLDMVMMYLYTQIKVCSFSFSKVLAWTDRQTDLSEIITCPQMRMIRCNDNIFNRGNTEDIMWYFLQGSSVLASLNKKFVCSALKENSCAHERDKTKCYFQNMFLIMIYLESTYSANSTSILQQIGEKEVFLRVNCGSMSRNLIYESQLMKFL